MVLYRRPRPTQQPADQAVFDQVDPPLKPAPPTPESLHNPEYPVHTGKSKRVIGVIDNNQIGTGPDPFPYRLPKTGLALENPLIPFYKGGYTFFLQFFGKKIFSYLLL
jgi:hypothetical protein